MKRTVILLGILILSGWTRAYGDAPCGCSAGEFSPTNFTANICDESIILATSAPITCGTNGTGTITLTETYDLSDVSCLGDISYQMLSLNVAPTCSHGNDISYTPPTVTITIETCSDCSAGEDDYCASSIGARFNLGRGLSGKYAGHLSIYSPDIPDATYATPATLKLQTSRPGDMDVVRDGATDELRQILALETFVQIAPSNQYSYTIDFFYPDSVEPELDTNGWYVLKSGENPFVSYLISNPDGGTTNAFERLRFVKNQGGEISTNEFTWQQDTNGVVTWGLLQGGGLRNEYLAIEEDGGETIKTRTIRDHNNEIVSVTSTTYTNINSRLRPIVRVVDPDGEALTTIYNYHADGKRRLTVNPDGSWRENIYTNGLISQRRTGWLDAATNAADNAIQIISYNYTPITGTDDTGVVDRGTPRTETTTIAGERVSKTMRAIYRNTFGDKIVIEERCSDPQAAFGAAGNLRTERHYLPENDQDALSERILYVEHPDGRTESYDYDYGVYDPGLDSAAGSFTENGTGSFIRVTLTHGTVTATNGIANRTTRDIGIENLTGKTLQTETYIYDGSGYQLAAWTKNTLNDLGQIVTTRDSTGAETETQWSCCGPEWQKDAQGIETSLAYDDLDRLVLRTRQGHGDIPNLIESYTLDALGRRIITTRSGDGIVMTSSNRYNMAGRLTHSWDQAGLLTTHDSEILANGGRRDTQTLPGGGTRITETYRDGQVAAVSGTVATAETYAYGIDQNGRRWTKRYSGPDGTNSMVWSQTFSDALGRTVETRRPGYGAVTIVETSTYNNLGKLTKTETSGFTPAPPATLYEYDSLGNLVRSGQDVNGNGSLDLASMDRIQDSDTAYWQGSPGTNIVSGWWRKQTATIYPVDNSSDAVTTSIQYSRLSGFNTNITAESVSIDIHGNLTRNWTEIDRSARVRVSLVDTPHTSITATQTNHNGRLIASISASGLTTTYAYDGLDRRTGVTDPRTGESLTGYDAAGRLAWSEDADGNRTTNAYEAATGRLDYREDALGQRTYHAYDIQGRLTNTWGATYPVGYEYDDFGRMTAMRTWRDEQGTPDTTAWHYDQATGLLTNKLYADGKGPSYTYTADGKLATRTWERGITTTYGYDALGQLTSVAYSDATPSVTNTYDRLGRQSTVSSLQSAVSFAYNPDTLALTNETIIANGATNVITREHDALGRNSGFNLTHPQTPTPPYSVTYGYDAYGRFNAVSSSVFSAFSVANYSHLPNSDLLSGYTITGTGDVLAVSRTYEDHRNLITAVEHEVDSTLISRYTYSNNQIGHRTHVVNQGSAFADVGDAMNFYGYNTRGEVTNAVRRWGNNPNNPGATVAGQTFGYDYDPIGNRTWSKRGDYAREYAANELNQMTSRGVPGVAHLLGSADETATVTVNSQSVTRQNAYWYKDLAVTNDTAPQYPEIVIDATWSNILSSVTGNVFVAETPEDFGYDGDGNTTNDGRFAYTWDGENRLTAVETLPAVVAASGAPQVRVEYAYDHMSRRIGKAVLNAYTNGAYATTNQTAYVYDGWNLISELTYSETHTLTNFYTWGLDLSGSLQGAGGIGGLLSMIEGRAGSPSTPLFFTADANGNIGQLLDAANPTNILAHYEYSPFGETLVAVGDLATANPFRFSTKYHEDESGLVYYGYRYYSPGLGRWVNRDPIGERGGVNVYGFVRNETVGVFDPRGLSSFHPIITVVTEGKATCDCGGATYSVKWGIPDANTDDAGWIIQLVKVAFDVKDCDDNAIDVKEHTGGELDTNWWPLWEGWEFTVGGDVWVGPSSSGVPGSGDTFAMKGFGDCTKGTIKITGEVKAIVDYILPNDFVVSNEQPTGALPATFYEPTAWGDEPQGAAHTMTIEWNCCPQGTVTTATTVTTNP